MSPHNKQNHQRPALNTPNPQRVPSLKAVIHAQASSEAAIQATNESLTRSVYVARRSGRSWEHVAAMLQRPLQEVLDTYANHDSSPAAS